MDSGAVTPDIPLDHKAVSPRPDDGPPKRHPLAKFLSGAAITIGFVLLKVKAVGLLVFDFFRGYAVNPFEGFGVM
jgi:hypothetical protein